VQQPEVIADYGDLVGEGPVWDEDTGNLHWVDLLGRRFYGYHWATKTSSIVKEGIEITGFANNRPGGFVIANTQGIWTWDGGEQISLVASEVNGVKCRMNDAIADPAGRFLAASCFYEADREYPLGHLIQVGGDGRASILDEGIHIANGLGFSPDCQTLYFTDSAARCIYAYDYDVEKGSARNRRVVIKVPENEGLPDGMTVDAEGFIWSAQWYGSGVVRYDPEGRVERRIAVPAKQTSSVAFGGEDLTDIFITSAGRSFPTPLMPHGYDPSSGYCGGRLYHMNLGIRGKPEFKTNLCLPPTRPKC
jgi:sugar lactone lactonase YvrE